MVLVPDHRAPKVVMNLRYGVGSIVVAGDPDVVMPQLAAIGLRDVQVVKREETEEQTAMRALDLLGNKRQASLSASPWRVGDGGTTRAVHSCAGDRDCGAQIHAD